MPVAKPVAKPVAVPATTRRFPRGMRWPITPLSSLVLAPVGLLALLAALIHWHGRLPYPDSRWAYTDASHYVAMAQQPFGSTNPLALTPPYCWRILTPLLVHLLPLPLLDGFWWVDVVSLGVATLALQWVLAGLGLSRGVAVAGGFAFVLLGPVTGFELWAYQYIDPLSLCLTILAIGCAIHRRGGWLVVLAVAGAFAKETALLGVFFALAWAWSHHDRVRWRWSLGALGGALGVLAALRLLIHPLLPYDLLGDVVAIWIGPPSPVVRSLPLVTQAALVAIEFGQRMLMASIGAWGALLPFAVLQLRHPPRLWRAQSAMSVLLLAATAQIVVAWDAERVVMYACPAMIAAACYEIEYLTTRWHVSRWMLWGPLLAYQALIWWPYARGVDQPGGWPGLLAFNPVWRLLIAAPLLLLLALWLWRRLRLARRQRHPAPSIAASD